MHYKNINTAICGCKPRPFKSFTPLIGFGQKLFQINLFHNNVDNCIQYNIKFLFLFLLDSIMKYFI